MRGDGAYQDVHVYENLRPISAEYDMAKWASSHAEYQGHDASHVGFELELETLHLHCRSTNQSLYDSIVCFKLGSGPGVVQICGIKLSQVRWTTCDMDQAMRNELSSSCCIASSGLAPDDSARVRAAIRVVRVLQTISSKYWDMNDAYPSFLARCSHMEWPPLQRRS